ncbi:CDP-alcohol phosphatidyltransferase family protein [bacterium]|nr:CDP-alcohol phosphatidyltransferase family protein [bacterium]
MKTLFVVDASSDFAKTRLWGLTLTERIVLSLQGKGFLDVLIISDFTEKELFFRELHKPVKIQKTFEGNFENFEKVFLLQGNAVFDFRIFELLQKQFFNLKSSSNILLLEVKNKVKDLSELSKFSETEFLDFEKQDTYIAKLRKHLVWKCVLVENEKDLETGSDILKNSVQKGVNDLPAQIIHPPFEFFLTKIAAKTKITPNQITYLSISIAFGLTPVFYYGYFGIALFFAFVMGILDGVDGKLARLTFRTSQGGDLLDHVSDIVYLSFWYFAIGWHFYEKNPNPMLLNGIILLQVVYYADRIVLGLFKKRHKAELHDYRKIDCWFRKIGARRNTCFWLLVFGFLVNDFLFGFWLVVAWTSLTFLFHALRGINEFNKPSPAVFQG